MKRLVDRVVRSLAAWIVVCLAPLPFLDLLLGVQVTRDVAALNTTVLSTIALFLSLYISRRLFGFPGTRQLAQGVWAILAGFGIVAAFLFFLRLPYSTVLFGYSLAASIVLMTFWKGFFGNSPRNYFQIVPFGDVGAIEELTSVTLVRMEQPDLPERPDASIVADLRADLPPDWERMLAQAALRGIPVYHFKLLQESIAGKVKIEHLSENTLGSLVPDQSYNEVKWVIDRIGALILIPLLTPLLLIVALIIKLQDGGSVFYNQPRVGLGGTPFTIYKFRSMSAGPPGDLNRESAVTLDNDPRITRFGALIRRYRIDELPQILNILKGDMSFIGPRPEAIPLAEWYDKELPFYSYRHIVRPGLTGWAQVNQGHVADLSSIDYKLQYDFYYVKYFSAWLDMLIVLRTIRTILTGFGSK